MKVTMKRLNSAQQTQHISKLERQQTSVLEPEVITITPTESSNDIFQSTTTMKWMLPKLVLGVFLGAGAIASGIYGYRWWQYNQQYSQKYQTTDNAYVSADIQSITSRIPGIVTEVAVHENQEVFPRMTLVRLDPSSYQLSLAQAKASLELAKQQAALAQKKLDSSAISSPEPEPFAANKNSTQVNRAAINRDKMLQVQTTNQQKEVNQLQYKTALAAIAQKLTDLEKAELQLSYTNITALTAGKVSSKNVQVGQLVQPGQTLVTIVQPHPWITANFKETQVGKIQPGQKVDIKIAAFPSQHFQGKVDSLSPTSVGRVDLQQQDHAKDNSTNSHDVQQIPVKIVFDHRSIQGYESRITPGMSATAVVETQ
jgi:membrane fusion protein (multidrug efflux system)